MTDTESFADRLAAVHAFPCRYTFKLIGARSPALERSVLEAIEAVLPGERPTVSHRPSATGKYLALTVEIEAPSVTAVLDLYERFRVIEGLTHLL
ncbi:MAG: hypothetical protein AMXMBFR64_03890 [Myxococcales bacterium]